MEKKFNKYFIIITIAIIGGLIIGTTFYKVEVNHNNKVLLVEKKYIIEAAKKCFNEKKCDKYPITLKELYDLGIIPRQVNEVTKEYYNENSYVEEANNNYDLIIVN